MTRNRVKTLGVRRSLPTSAFVGSGGNLSLACGANTTTLGPRFRGGDLLRATGAKQVGFSLVELIVVIVVLGILGSTVAVFIEGPVRAYFDSIRRARLTDAADTVARRLAREMQDALPNSVRVSTGGGTVFMEFIPIRDVGRYRTAASAGAEPGGIDALDFSDGADASFDVLGRAVSVPANAHLVIYNLGSGAFDAYGGGNRRAVGTAPGTTNAISFTATGTPLPADAPEHRFYLVTTAVTYACTPAADGSGRVERYSGYALQAAQPVAAGTAPLAAATRTLVVDGVSACNFELGNTLSTLDQVSVRLQLSAGGETATLFTQVQLGNAP